MYKICEDYCMYEYLQNDIDPFKEFKRQVLRFLNKKK